MEWLKQGNISQTYESNSMEETNFCCNRLHHARSLSFKSHPSYKQFTHVKTSKGKA